MQNKRGWIQIVEAFVAILLIVGVLLIVLGRRDLGTENSLPAIHDKEISILREIQLSDELRENVLTVSPLPATWNSTQFPTGVKTKIEEKTPSNLECVAQICQLSDSCVLSDNQEKDVFAESVIISASLETYAPRTLKIFCWGK